MSVYRNLLKNESIVPPIVSPPNNERQIHLNLYFKLQIPMFPVCMKDLTFIHLGNQTQDDDLVITRKLVSVFNRFILLD
jgi:hypothetical protein